jgi:hypothetical protein
MKCFVEQSTTDVNSQSQHTLPYSPAERYREPLTCTALNADCPGIVAERPWTSALSMRIEHPASSIGRT